MPRAAVLGRPIAHSLSPVLHRAAYEALGLRDWTYTAIECDADGLPGLLAGAGGEWAGFSCTMPVKEAALAAAAEPTARAELIGAANTLIRLGPDRWRADNTDVYGIAAAVAESGPPPAGLAILGAGGTARAAIAAAAEWGLSEVDLVVREPARAAAAVSAAARFGLRADVLRLDDAGTPGAVTGAPLVISTLPRAAADICARWTWRPGHRLLDVVYDPWPTVLAAAAASSGVAVLTGAAMLLHQAVEQVRLMTGHEPPIEPMRAALRAAAPPGSL